MSTADLLNDLNEEPPVKDRPLYSKNGMKWLATGAIMISFFWVIVNTIYSHYYLGAENARYLNETFMIMAIANLVVIPAASFIPALLICLFPIKERSYKRKLLPVWLWCVIILSCVFFIAAVITN